MRSKLGAIILLLFVACSSSFAESKTWSDLARWVGKYPGDKTEPAGTGMLEYEKVEKALNRLLPPFELQTLKAYTLSPRVKRVGNFIIVNKCLPHDCPSELAMLVFDTGSERLWAGFFTREGHRVATTWYGNSDDYTVLPVAILKEFAERHGY